MLGPRVASVPITVFFFFFLTQMDTLFHCKTTQQSQHTEIGLYPEQSAIGGERTQNPHKLLPEPTHQRLRIRPLNSDPIILAEDLIATRHPRANAWLGVLLLAPEDSLGVQIIFCI
jgi:hypothetical protein